MNQQDFEQLHCQLWQELEGIVGGENTHPGRQFPSQYRTLCQQLAVAKSRQYTTHLINRLNTLVVSCHHILYKNNRVSEQRWLWFLSYGFPSAIKNNITFVLVAATLFTLPLIAMTWGCMMNDELIYSVADSSSVASYESMYNPENRRLGRERDSATDINMFGHYIQNNIGIGFRSFASGLLFGLGSMFFLIYNGIHIGAVAGHLTQIGYSEPFYGFVVGHAAFELTGIVFCGAAGLKLGYSLVNPGQLTRLTALRFAAKDAILIVYGSALMLLIAAFIEAFWSSSQGFPLNVKLFIGGAITLLLFSYFVLCGRRYES